MKNSKSTYVLKREETEEIRKTFTQQSNFIKGLIIFTCVQYLVLLVIL